MEKASKSAHLAPLKIHFQARRQWNWHLPSATVLTSSTLKMKMGDGQSEHIVQMKNLKGGGVREEEEDVSD